MNLLLDTSFIIAVNDLGDSNHKLAQSLKIRIKNNEFGKCCISDYIFDELMTFLRAKSFPQDKIKSIGEAFLSDKTIELLRINQDIFLQSWELFKKINKLSFTDCTTIILAKEFRIKYVASFDSGFDMIPHIKRI